MFIYHPIVSMTMPVYQLIIISFSVGIDYIQFLEFTDSVPVFYLSNQLDGASSPINIQNGLPFGDRIQTIAYVSNVIFFTVYVSLV